MVEGGMKCIKFLLFVFNFIFVLAGIGLIAAGAYVKIKLDDYFDFFGNDYTGPGILLIVVGVIIFLIAFLGCCGAIKENYCMIVTFTILLIVIFLLQLGGGIAGVVMRDNVDKEVNDILKDAMKNYNTSGGVRKTWDKMQDEFSCCGVDSYKDWQTDAKLSTPPASCCKVAGSQKCTFTSTADLQTEGCTKAFEGFVKDNIIIIGGIGIGLALVQLIGIIFAICMCRAIKSNYEVV